MKRKLIIVFLLLFPFLVYSQELVYFNNIYTYNGNYTIGMSVIDNGEAYFGYGATDDIGIYQELFLFKLSYTGEMQLLKTYYEPNYTFYPGIIGGAMIESWDNKFILAYHYSQNGVSYGALMKLDNNLDTIWKRSYTPSYKTASLNCVELSDNGYLITGWVFQSEEDFSDALLLKTDSLGNYQWHQLYGGYWAEHGTNVIETPDGGYLLGGYFWKPGYDHSQDAMLIKTDSLGNEEWTNYYGNPDVDDDMALLALADDGNYLVATLYGEWIIAPEARTGRIYLIKVDTNGDIIWAKKISPKMYALYIKNLRQTTDGNLIASGFYIDSADNYIYKGFMYKFSQDGDSIWMRDYHHFNNQYDWNLFYDAYPTSDNGYITIGKARPEMGGNNNMWIVKVDSMGCDTPGCATGTQVYEFPKTSIKQIRVWPNPASDLVHFQIPESTRFSKGTIVITNIHGRQVASIPINSDQVTWDASKVPNGIYFYRLATGNQLITGKILIK